MTKLQFDSYLLDTSKCELFKSGVKVDIEPQVYCLLELLIKNNGDIVSRDDIINVVWGGRHVSNNTIDNRMKTVRAVIGDNGRDQRLIKTYPNRGYRFIGQLQELESQPSTPSQRPRDIPVTSLKSHGTQDETAALDSIKSNKIQIFATIVVIALFSIGLILSTQKFFKSNANPITPNIQTAKISNQDESNHGASHLFKGEDNAKIAILPFQVIGAGSNRKYLSNILDNEFRQAITAVQGLSVISISKDTQAAQKNDSMTAFINNLDIDYFVTAVKTNYENEVQLVVQLICNTDKVILWSKKYTLDTTSEELSAWPANTAINSTIAIANTLELSINQNAPLLLSYAFQEKVAQARQLLITDEYDKLSEAIILLQDAIKEEPNYLPAYDALYNAHWRRLVFIGEEFQSDVRSMFELAAKMEKISPNAPETLIAKAVTSRMGTSGASKSSIGQKLNQDWETLLNKALEKDPDNTSAYAYKAFILSAEGYHPVEKKIRAHEDALQYSPTDPDVLANFGYTLLCSRKINAARTMAQSNLSWNPNNSLALDSIARIAHATADYPAALEAMNSITQKGRIQHDITQTLRAIYFDLGAPEKTLNHVRYAPAKSLSYAMMGEHGKALIEAQKVPNFSSSQMAMFIIGADADVQNFHVYPHYKDIIDSTDGFEANSCSLNWLTVDIYGLKHSNPARSKILIDLLDEYYKKHDLESLQTVEEYTGLMALHILQDRPDDALMVMDVAMDKGFVFINRFKQPILRQLVTHVDFPKRLNIMQDRAAKILSDFEGSLLQ